MTHEEKIALVQVMSNESDEDKINAMLTLSGSKILRKAFPFDDDVEEVPVKYHVLQCEIASYLMGRMEALGEIRHNENGVDITWSSPEVPGEMLKDVTPYVRAWGATE